MSGEHEHRPAFQVLLIRFAAQFASGIFNKLTDGILNTTEVRIIASKVSGWSI